MNIHNRNTSYNVGGGSVRNSVDSCARSMLFPFPADVFRQNHKGETEEHQLSTQLLTTLNRLLHHFT